MKQVLTKHSSILLEDPHLKTTLQPKPKFSYRKARNVKSLVAPSKLKSSTESPIQSLWLIPLIAMFQCCKAIYLTCKYVAHSQKEFTVHGKT